MQDHASESGIAVAAKLTPPAGISLATIFGMQVSELVLWATLVYTILMIGHKIYVIYRDVKSKQSK
jgi:hypothetical protein